MLVLHGFYQPKLFFSLLMPTITVWLEKQGSYWSK